MTIQDAIELLSEIRCRYNWFDDSERRLYVALSMAIKALFKLEENPCDSCQEFDCYACIYK